MSQTLQTDILEELSQRDLQELTAIYERPENANRTKHIRNLLKTSSQWKTSEKYANSVNYYSPNSCWREDGTLFVFFTCACYDIVIFSLQKSGDNLYKGLFYTNRIDFTQNIYFYAVHNSHLPIFLQCMQDRHIQNVIPEVPGIIHEAPESAKDWIIEIPDEVYIKELMPDCAEKMNNCWPHRYPGSEKFLSAIIEVNGGWGVFLKSNNELVSWILHHRFGLGTLQTDDNYKRKGYGKLILTYATKTLAQKGFYVNAAVWTTNESSMKLFENVGFKKGDFYTYVSINLKR